MPLRTQIPIYAAGMFANSLSDVASVVLPLWLSKGGISTAEIGLVLGVRHLLPFLFSIHGGALMQDDKNLEVATGRRFAQAGIAASMSTVVIRSFSETGWGLSAGGGGGWSPIGGSPGSSSRTARR